MLVNRLSSVVTQEIIGEDRVISGIALDSRKVKKDYLFLAVKGDVQDGHAYISQAIANGANAVAVEDDTYLVRRNDISYVHVPSLKHEAGHIAARYYNHPSAKMNVVGVTGTNGKTSITHYIAEILKYLNVESAVIGTLGIEYKNNSIVTNNTTPDAITLQKSFYEMIESDVVNVAMEVSSHALEQGRCEGVCFTTAIISNITHDHLDYHGNFANYEKAKLKLFSWPELSVAIFNLDDNSATKIQKIVSSKIKSISYSVRNEKADVFLSGIHTDICGYSATLHYFHEQCEFNVNLLGEFNLYNILAAVISVVEQGFPLVDVIRAVSQVQPVAGRMQKIANSHNIIAVVDYAHTPDALENVLKSLKKQVIGNIIVVFGCGGDRDREKRPIMAAIAEKNAGYVIITADNPRNESLENILSDIESGMTGSQYSVLPQRDEAIVYAVNKATAGDCILVAGKGHEKTQIIGDEIKSFDDVAVLEKALKNRKVAIC